MFFDVPSIEGWGLCPFPLNQATLSYWLNNRVWRKRWHLTLGARLEKASQRLPGAPEMLTLGIQTRGRMTSLWKGSSAEELSHPRFSAPADLPPDRQHQPVSHVSEQSRSKACSPIKHPQLMMPERPQLSVRKKQQGSTNAQGKVRLTHFTLPWGTKPADGLHTRKFQTQPACHQTLGALPSTTEPSS